jgi:hypothetical protein
VEAWKLGSTYLEDPKKTKAIIASFTLHNETGIVEKKNIPAFSLK